MLERALTINRALDRACRWYANRPALIEHERVVTYDGFADSIRRIATGYADLGVTKGDRVALLSTATVDHALAYYAAHYAGAIAVNLHYRESPDHQFLLLQRLAAKVLVHDPEKSDMARELKAKLPSLRTVCFGDRNQDSDAALSHLLSLSPVEGDVENSVDDAAIIQLSSGSTGTPKALVHSHASVLESWSGGLYMWSGIEPHDCFLNAFAPSFTVWLVHAGSFLIHGGSVVFQDRWNATSFLGLVQSRRVTCAALTPTQWRDVLLTSPERYDLSSLRMSAYLGERMPPERLRELVGRVCKMFCSFYGMAECLGLGGCVVRSPDFIEAGKWGSIGKPSLNSDLRIAAIGGTAREELPRKEIGEVVVRAASFARENWGDPQWKDRVLTPDGWYRTGDLGYVDEDGYVFLVGRVDNQINTGGIKVAPEEIEQIVGGHPDLADVAILGVEDEKWGQRIVGLVVRRNDDVSSEKLDEWCKASGRLAGFKCPKEWLFVRALPVNSVGKKDRRALGALYDKERARSS